LRFKLYNNNNNSSSSNNTNDSTEWNGTKIDFDAREIKAFFGEFVNDKKYAFEIKGLRDCDIGKKEGKRRRQKMNKFIT